MEFLTVKETAQLLRVSPITVRRYIASGQLAAERVGRGIRVRREAIEEFVAPVKLVSETWDTDAGDLPTLRESLGDIIRIGSSGEPTNIANHKDEYIADAIADWYSDEEDENIVEIVSPSSPGGVEFVPAHKLVDRPTTEDDPLWDIVGIGTSEGPNDVARNKHKYLADALFARKSRG